MPSSPQAILSRPRIDLADRSAAPPPGDRRPVNGRRRARPGARQLRVAAALALVLTLLGVAHARFEWRNVVQEVDILPDGTVIVDDTRTLWTDEDFGEAFICVGHGPEVSITLLDGSGAVDPGPDADALQQACESGARGTELVVRNATRVSERRVRFRYRMTGTVEAYGDVVQWYWNLVQLDHPPIVGYRLTVQAPGPMDDPYDAFVHRYANPERPTVNMSADRSTLTVAFDRIPGGDGLEVRWLMPPSAFSIRGSGDRLEQFLREETELARIDVQGSPWVNAPARVETVGATVSFGGTARDPNGIERVVAQAGTGERIECEGTAEFTCRLDAVLTGHNHVTVLAYDTNGMIGSAHVTVVRLTVLDRLLSSRVFGLLPFLLVGWLTVGVGRAYAAVGREPRIDAMKYPFEPPSDLPPAAVTSLMWQSASASHMGPAFHATIMDLARRGYGTFTGSGRKFEMELHPDRGEGELLPFEAAVLGYLTSAAKEHRRGDDLHLAFDELKSYSQKRGQSFLSSWTNDVRGYLEDVRGGKLLSDESRQVSRTWNLRAFLVAAACFGGFVIASGAAKPMFVAAAILAVVALFASAQALPAWRPEIAREVAGWKGFKRTLTDYTRMKDAPSDFFRLWDVYFCYAAALGVAEKFLRSLERAAPLAGVDQHDLMRRSAWLHAGAATPASLSSLAAATSQLSSSLRTASASASSGGSVGGGGGGGGGGGSSGGR